MTDRASNILLELLKQSPNMVAIIITVGLFVVSIDRSEAREQTAIQHREAQAVTAKEHQEEIDELRIENFLNVSGRSSDVVEKLTTAIESQTAALLVQAESNTLVVGRFNEFARSKYATLNGLDSIMGTLQVLLNRKPAIHINSNVQEQ